MSDSRSGLRRELRTHVIGYLLALVLTGLAFAAVATGTFDRHATIGAVFALGFVQMLVHFRYSLHIDFKKSVRDDLQLVLFSFLIVLLMVGGSLTILMNLRYRMM